MRVAAYTGSADARSSSLTLSRRRHGAWGDPRKLGSEAGSEHARDQRPHSPPLEHAREPRRRAHTPTGEDGAHDATLHDELERLREQRGPSATALNAREVTGADASAEEGLAQHVRGGDGVLQGKVDPDPADGRHRVGRIAEEKEAGPKPA